MLNAITDGVWTVDDRFTAPGLSLPLRMTVLRLPSGGLLLYSPVPLSAETADAIEALGAVEHIVAPSLLHHLHVGPAADRFSSAAVWGAPGLAKKRRDLTGLQELPAESPLEGIELVRIEGAPMLQEVCALHQASRTMLCADLVFNMHDVGGWFGGVFTWMTGTNGKLAMSRSWRMFSRQRSKTAESVGRVLDWAPERVLMGHGEPLLDDAAAKLRAAVFIKPEGT